ncbi:MAG: hypothetical protein IT373_23445 [Polyangiaceae bacterium]|nr:hypothetical protein [Polyangiaceae bacterium]
MNGRRWLWSIFADRRVLRGAVPWLVLLLIAANVYVALARGGWEAARDANLLAPTTDPGRHVAGAPRYDWSVGEDVASFWPKIPDATVQSVVILAGMSQMYAINDPRPGDETIVEHLDDKLRQHGVRAFGLAAPNMHNEEALLYLVAAASRPETRPAAFVYGLCFDKFRNVDLRPALQRFLRSRADVQDRLRALCAEPAGRYPRACEKIRSSLASLEDVATGTAQHDESIEGWLRDALGRAVPIIGAREALNARLQYELYLLRNWLFRIRATSKRPILHSRYELNRELLALMADVARAEGIELVLYVIPLNPQAENPYVPEEYEAFKSWSAAFADERGVPFANLEDVVPRDDWGLLGDEPDFKHFRAEGHRRTAEALVDRFGPIFVAAKGRTPAP